MKRLSIAVVVVLALVLAFVAGTYAAAKSYQFSGVVKAVDGGSLTVEKSAKETWQFELAKDTKGGTPKVGDKVTVYYKMVTTEIEQKPATTSAAKKK
jgi:riboflavin synthase alpha subunit